MNETQFLEKIKNNGLVSIYLKSGIALNGIVKDFDDKTILLDNTLIYKTVIASIQLGGNNASKNRIQEK